MTNPGFTFGQVPTAAQWNNAFDQKQDTLGYTPVNRAGDTMTGKLITTASIAGDAGFSIPPGVAPTIPVNGDIWMTTAGVFAQVNGSATLLGTIGAVISGTAGQLAYYSTTGSVIAGNPNVTIFNGALTLGQSSTPGSIILSGLISGGVTLASAKAGGSGTITFPAGTVDFSASGGPGQVVVQGTVGGIFTVRQLTIADFNASTTGSGAIVLAGTPTFTSTINIVTGIQINGSAASGNVLRGNGTNFISAQLAASDLSNSTSGTGAVVLVGSPTFIGGLTVAGTVSGSFPISASSLGSPQYGGTITNDNAPAGYIGEYISSTISVGGTLTLTSGTVATITSITLTAGDWNVWGVGVFTGSVGTTVSELATSISGTVGTLDTSVGHIGIGFYGNATPFNSALGAITNHIMPLRFSLAGTATVYLLAVATFGTSFCTAYGGIFARRVR